MLLIFLSALAVGFSGAMMPGSLLTYTIRQALSRGPKSGFIITTGHAILELVLIILIFLGFDKVLKADAAQIIIGVAGGALLIQMGLSMILNTAKNKVSIELDGSGSKSGNMLLSGILISASNPYFILWWAVVGLGFVMQSYNSAGIMGVATYYVGHITADFIWYGMVSVVVGTTRRFISHKVYRMVIGLLGGMLIFFGGKFVHGAIKTLIHLINSNGI